MDLNIVEHLIPNLAALLHLNPSTVLLLLLIGSFAAKNIGAKIPDSAVGWKGFVRDVAKFFGNSPINVVQPGVTTRDVLQDAVSLGIGKSGLRETTLDLGVADTFKPPFPNFPGAKALQESTNDSAR